MMTSSRFNRRGRVQPTPPVCAWAIGEGPHGPHKRDYCKHAAKILDVQGLSQIVITVGPNAGEYLLRPPVIPVVAMPGSVGAFEDLPLYDYTLFTKLDCTLATITSFIHLQFATNLQVIEWAGSIPAQAAVTGVIPTGVLTVVNGDPTAVATLGWIGTL